MGVFTLSQHTYGFYEDDNSDPDSCTIIGSINNPQSWAMDTNLMVRIGLDETQNKTLSVVLDLEYQVNGTGGTWNNVTTTSSNARIATGTPSDGTACNAQNLTAGSGGTRIDGEYDDGSGTLASYSHTKDDWVEHQWCVTLRSADLSNNDVVYFRVAGANITYSAYAQVTATGATQVQKSVGLDAALKEVITKSVTLNAALKDTFTKSVLLNAQLAQQYQKLVGLDSALQGAIAKTTTINAYLVPPVMLKASSYIGDSGENTVFRTTGNGGMNPPSGLGSGDFSTGRVQDDENPADSIAAASSGFTELEWNIEGLLNGTYKFRITKGGTPVTLSGISNPQLTISAGDTYTKSVELDAALKGLIQKSVGIDAALKDTFTKAVGLDASLANIVTKLVELDATLQGVFGKNVNLDAALKDSFEKDVGLDAALQEQIAKLVSIDAALVQQVAKSINLDATLKEIATKAVALDAALKDSFQKSVTLNAQLVDRITKDIGLDAVLQGIFTKAVALDARLVGVVMKYVALDAALQQQGLTKAVGLDAALVEQVQKLVNINAALQAVLTKSVEIDAALLGTIAKSVGINAVLLESYTKNVGLDAALLLQTTKDVGLDGALLEHIVKLVTLDAYLESGITAISQQRSLFRFVSSRMHGRVN